MKVIYSKLVNLIVVLVIFSVVFGCGESKKINTPPKEEKVDNTETARDAVNFYVSTIGKYNFDLAYTLLSSEVKQKWTKSEFWAKEGEKNIDLFNLKYEISDIKLSKSSQFLRAEAILKFENGEERVLNLIEERGEWKITF